MFRDDRNALLHQVDALDKESTELRHANQAMREQLLAQQRGGAATQLDVYRTPVSQLAPGLRAALGHHTLQHFPVWAMAALHICTLGIFPLIHFGLCHDRLPRVHPNDPSAGRAIGFAFIPYFNLYWVFFNSLRLTDRINLQFRVRDLPPHVPRGLVVATAILTVIPYINILIGLPIMWTIAVCFMQSAINRLVQLPAPDVETATQPQG